MMTLSASRSDSKESIYTSATSDNEENCIKRPHFLTGSSESSLIDDNSRSRWQLSPFQTLSQKINMIDWQHLLAKRQPVEKNEENQINVRILGFEIIERERKFAVSSKNITITGMFCFRNTLMEC